MDLDRLTDKRKAPIKKQYTMNNVMDEQENISSNSQYLFLPEYKSEKIMSELLTKVMTF